MDTHDKVWNSLGCYVCVSPTDSVVRGIGKGTGDRDRVHFGSDEESDKVALIRFQGQTGHYSPSLRPPLTFDSNKIMNKGRL